MVYEDLGTDENQMEVDVGAPTAKKRKIINEQGQEITTGGLKKPVRNTAEFSG